MKLDKYFWIALFYSILGTLALCSSYPSNPLYNDQAVWFILLTFPCSIIGCIVLFTCGFCIFWVTIAQLFSFTISWVILKRLFNESKIKTKPN